MRVAWQIPDSQGSSICNESSCTWHCGGPRPLRAAFFAASGVMWGRSVKRTVAPVFARAIPTTPASQNSFLEIYSFGKDSCDHTCNCLQASNRHKLVICSQLHRLLSIFFSSNGSAQGILLGKNLVSTLSDELMR